MDDQPDVIEALRIGFELRWREIDVIGAGDGPTALYLIEQAHPDIVLLDIGLPEMDGFEVLRQVRAFSDVPVMMLIARDDAIDKVKGLVGRGRLRDQALQPLGADGPVSGQSCVASTCQDLPRALHPSGAASWRRVSHARRCALPASASS